MIRVPFWASLGIGTQSVGPLSALDGVGNIRIGHLVVLVQESGRAPGEQINQADPSAPGRLAWTASRRRRYRPSNRMPSNGLVEIRCATLRGEAAMPGHRWGGGVWMAFARKKRERSDSCQLRDEHVLCEGRGVRMHARKSWGLPRHDAAMVPTCGP